MLEAAYGSGLSGPSRLHDLFVTIEAVTPGEYRNGGQGVTIRWGVHPTPFGKAFFASTDRGLTSLQFVPNDDLDEPVASLRETWPKARLLEEPEATLPMATRIFGRDSQHRSIAASPAFESTPGSSPPLRLHVQGTNFQLRVWNALLRIPPGAAVTYADVASAIGKPEAARAVGGAVGRNPIAVIIPCHRVLRSGGEFGQYRWRQVRKKAMLAWESAQLECQDDDAA